MTKYDTSKFLKQSRPTNCFQTCVASMFGISIDEVPIGCDGANWDWNSFQDWLADRGLQAIEICLSDDTIIYHVQKPVLCILTGKSPRKNLSGLHAVIGEYIGFNEFNMIHDPHESNAWIDGYPTHVTFFVSI